jgi:hypothetical protein
MMQNIPPTMGSGMIMKTAPNLLMIPWINISKLAYCITRRLPIWKNGKISLYMWIGCASLVVFSFIFFRGILGCSFNGDCTTRSVYGYILSLLVALVICRAWSSTISSLQIRVRSSIRG